MGRQFEQVWPRPNSEKEKGAYERFGYLSQTELSIRLGNILNKGVWNVVNEAVGIYGDLVTAYIVRSQDTKTLSDWKHSVKPPTVGAKERLAIALDYAYERRRHKENDLPAVTTILGRNPVINGHCLAEALHVVDSKDLVYVHEASMQSVKYEKNDIDFDAREPHNALLKYFPTWHDEES